MPDSRLPEVQEARAAIEAHSRWLKANGHPYERKRTHYGWTENPHDMGTPEYAVRESACRAALYVGLAGREDEQRAAALIRRILRDVKALVPEMEAVEKRRLAYAAQRGGRMSEEVLGQTATAEDLLEASQEALRIVSTAWDTRFPTSFREWQAHVRTAMGAFLALGLDDAEVLSLFPVEGLTRAAQLKQLQRARLAKGLRTKRGRPAKSS